MGVKRIGDWDKLRAKLNGTMGVRLATGLRQATIKNAIMLVKEIKLGIRNQAPGGKPFVKLAESTIKQKGSSKALIDTGFLINSITQRIMEDKAFVGLLRTSTSKDGESMANIGAIMEYGCTINQPNGKAVVIPARPFLHPVMEKYRDQVIKNYRDVISSVL